MTIKKISDTGNATIDLVMDTIKLEKQAIVFVNTKKSAEKQAEDISKKIKNSNNDLLELSEKALRALPKKTKQCERLAKCIQKGIAFHHAGLVSKQRELIEDNFKTGKIKIICSTPSLAMGVDLPAFRAIIKDSKRYSAKGLVHIPVLEYLQMAGRAGRPKFDKSGEAISVAISDNEKTQLYEKYVLGKAEEIYSKLAVEPVLRTYLLSLIASEFVRTKNQILDFFGKTFWAHQFVDMTKLSFIIDKMLNLLDEWEFIQKDEDEFKSADKINDVNVKATRIGKRVAELYIDPLTAAYFINCLKNATNKKTEDFSFLQAICHTLEIRPLLRVGIKDQDMVQEYLVRYNNLLMEPEPSMYEPEYDDYLNSVKTAMMLKNWIEEKEEQYILDNFNARPGEIRGKLNIADWLLYSFSELSRMLQFQHLNKEIIKLRIRLKNGVKEELLPLIKVEGIGRVRARKLFFNKIKDLTDLKNTDIMKLVQILGRNVAIKVKKQLGQEVKIVPENKRKGQLSLEKY